MATAATPVPELLRHEAWDDELIAGAGIPIVDSYVVSVGGGLASFAVVQYLRVAGFTTSQIRVLSDLSAPYEKFEALLAASRSSRRCWPPCRCTRRTGSGRTRCPGSTTSGASPGT